MKVSKTVLLFIILACIGAVIWFGINFAPGSYSEAEKYTIDASESDVIKAVDLFKKNNPEYIVPEYLEFKDGRDKHWYYVYFYYPKENQIVISWLQQSEKEKTTFAFVGINDGLSIGKGRLINKDFDRSENEAQKKRFEEKFVTEIRGLVKK